jgi:putative ABC transport system substrate-binding protein
VITAAISTDIRAAVAAQLQALGWREDKDYVLVVPRGLIPSFAAVAHNVRVALNEKPDILVVGSTAGADWVRRQTQSLPIVMQASGYPVEAGIANSLARPGKNVTGNSIYAGTGVWGKHLELLRDVKPGIKRVAILWGYVPPAFPVAEIEPCYAEFRSSASALGLSIQIVEVPESERLASVVTAIAAERPDALLISAGLTIGDGWSNVVRLATERGLPTVTDYYIPADATVLRPLLTYSPDPKELWRQAISYVDRILRGANPGDLPIQQPAKFELTVNLRMAKAIRLDVPRMILLRADRVIE